MKEPFFFYSRQAQRVTIGEGRWLALAAFLERCPDFNPNDLIDAIIYEPGVRISVLGNGMQGPLPEFANQPNATDWPKGNHYIAQITDALTAT